MRVLLINQYFHPEVAAVAQMMADLAEDLAAQRLDVGVLCGRSKYAHIDNRGERRHLENVRVWRVRTIGGGSRRTVVRLLTYVSFIGSALIRSLFLPRHDVVVVFSSPPLVGVVAWAYSVLHRAEMVSVVEDLYPDIAVALGFLSANTLMVKGLRALSSFCLRHSSRVIALSEQMRNRLGVLGIQEDRIRVIHNWADGQHIQPPPRAKNKFIASHGLDEKFVVQYSGHMGEAHCFDALLGAALALQESEEIEFVFIGDGPRREYIEEYVSAKSLRNVTLLPYQPREALAESLGAASVSIITLRSEATGLVVPSKLYGVLAAGTPVIFIGSRDSHIAETIVAAECGFVLAPLETKALVDAILRLHESPDLASEMGRRARSVFERDFDRPGQTGKYAAVLRELGTSERT